MSRRKLILSIQPLVLVFAVLVVSGEPVFGQAAARPNRGAMPTGSYAVSDIENISLTNGNLSLGIPLASLPPIAGGKLGLTVRAAYNSKSWDTVRTERLEDPLNQGSKYVTSQLQLSDAGGWRVGAGYSIAFEDATADYAWLAPPPNDPEYNLLTQNRWTKIVLTAPDGAKHELRPTDYFSYGDGYSQHNHLRGYYKDNPNTVNGPVRYYSFDGSHLWARIDPNPFINPANPSMGRFYGVLQSWMLYLPDGTKVEQQISGDQIITDTNGNKVKIFTTEETPGVFILRYRDEQTNRDIKSTYDPAGNNGQGVFQYQYQTVGGIWVAIDINYGTTHVFGKRYEFGDSVCADASDFVDTNIPVVRSIVYPPTEPAPAQPRKFIFSYNSDTTDAVSYQWRPNCSGGYQTVTSASHGWGSLSQIAMPTGAIVNYGYGLDGNHYLPSNPDDAPREGVALKTLTHDSVSDTWQYSNSPAVGGFTAPDGSFVTETRYSSDPGFAHTYSGFGGKEELVYRTNTSNKVMVERHWTLKKFTGGETFAAGANVQVAFNPVVDAEYTSLLDDTPSHNPIKMSAKTFQYDYNGNLLSQTDYDWFDPSLVSRDAQGVPTGVPAPCVPPNESGCATELRVSSNLYYNPATTDGSNNVYAKRLLSAATPLILNALQQATLGPGTTQFSYDSQAYGFAPTVGNLTSQRTWDNVDNKWITSSQTYDLYGNVATRTDPKVNVTTFTYGDATHAMPTQVVVDPQNGTGTQTSTTVFDFSTGAVISQTDPNGNTSTIDYTNQLLGTVDPFARPGVTSGPLVNVGGVAQRQHATTTYYDSTRKVLVEADLNAQYDKLLKTRTTADMLGRVILTEQTEDGANFTIYSRKAYDQTGRITFASNPMRYNVEAKTDGWSRATTDILGRVIEVATFSGATQPAATGYPNGTGKVTSVYDANFTTVSDQADRVRRSKVDALGRLVRVDEPDAGNNLGSTSSPVQATYYEYSVLGNLLTTAQGVQTRTFTYDSLSRLRSATNPEVSTPQGVPVPVTYVYDDNGNLTSKTDARGVVTTYGYDALNRVTSRNYTDGTPSVTYSYDTSATNGKGRLASVSSSVSTYTYSGYDATGKALGASQTLGNQTYTFSNVYGLSGQLKSMNYPSGRTVNYTYDNAGRTSGLSGNLGDSLLPPRTYASAMTYSASGGMTREQFGTDTAIYHQLNYNVRGQLWDIRVGTGFDINTDWNRGALQSLYSLPYTYLGGSGPDNNGNVLATKHYRPLDESGLIWTISTDEYSYDALNRLTSVTEKYVEKLTPGGPTSTETQQFVQSYVYDRYGNRTIVAAPGATDGINRKQFTVNTANNRLGVPGGQTGTMTYDNAGNLTTDTYSGLGVTRVYDAENRMTKETQANSVEAGIYSYNGDGQRVKRKVNGVETWQVYGLGGELLAEYAQNGLPSSPQKEYGYRNGQLLVEVTAATAGWGSPPAFSSPNPLVAGVSEVKALHITELRTAINVLRTHMGMSNYTWIYSATTSDWISANPIIEMRIALDQALGGPSPAYSAGLAVGQSIKKDHIQELRDRVLASWNSGSGGVEIRWLVADQLGTPRIIIDKTGALANVKRHDYLPFGEELFAGTGGRTTGQGYSGDNVRQKFAGSERDNETGLDYMKARYYSGTMGRFTSVDPSRKSIIPTNPQTWNRYSYTYNNPLRYVDKNGKWPTETHDLIIRTAFDRLQKQQPNKVRQIQKGSESVDANYGKPVRLVLENTLVESMAPRHAMTPGSKVRELGKSAAQDWARGEASKFINQKMGEATEMQNGSHNQSTVSNTALNLFGQGAHTIMDGASPAHREFQVYDLAPYQTLAAISPVLAAALYKNDMDAHTAAESRRPTQDEMNHMVDDLRMQYLNAFGREMYEQAVSPEEREATDRRRNPRR